MKYERSSAVEYQHMYEYIIFFNVCHPEVFYTDIYNDESVKHNKLYYVYYCTRATCFDSYRIIFRPF